MARAFTSKMFDKFRGKPSTSMNPAKDSPDDQNKNLEDITPIRLIPRKLETIINIPISSSSSSGINNDVDGPKIWNQIQQKFENLAKLEDDNIDKPCIFQIPKVFREVSVYNDAYTPYRVAIGPYHAENPNLKPMQQYKLMFLKQLSFDYTENIIQKVFSDFANNFFSPKNIRRAKKYYGGIGVIDLNNFAQMLLTDGIFVVGFLGDFYGLFITKLSQPLDCNLTARERKEILRDLMLLENQLPFFILEQLFKFLYEDAVKSFSFIAYRVFRLLFPIQRDTFLTDEDIGVIVDNMMSPPKEPDNDEIQVRHLLHLIMLCCLPSQETKEVFDPPVFSQPFKSVTELHEAGVQFKKINNGENISMKAYKVTEEKRLLVKFNEGVLEIPRLTLDEYSESFFRNIVAFEQYYLDTFEMTSYIYLMDHLIDTSNDVQILQERDLIEN